MTKENMGPLSSFLTIITFVLIYFFGVSAFDVPSFIKSKLAASRIPYVEDATEIKNHHIPKKIPSSDFINHFLAEIVELNMNQKGKLYSSCVYALVTLLPLVFWFVFEFAVGDGVGIFINAILVVTFLICTTWACVFLIYYAPFASFENKTEIRFQKNKCTIISSVELGEQGNSLVLDRETLKFTAGAIKVLSGGPLDYLCLSASDHNTHINFIMVPRWYARIFLVPRLGDVSKILNKISIEK